MIKIIKVSIHVKVYIANVFTRNFDIEFEYFK
jgi:hypothetical protein